MTKDEVIINNSKLFNDGLKDLSLHNLKGEKKAISAYDYDLGDQSVPIIFSTNEEYETDYHIDAVDKMIIQRVVGLTLKRGIKETDDGLFSAMRFSIQELIGEITKTNNPSKNYFASVDEIEKRLKNLRKIDVCVDVKRILVDSEGNIKKHIVSSLIHRMFNVDLVFIKEVHYYTKKEIDKGYIYVYDFPDIWGVRGKDERQIMCFNKDLFNFKNLPEKIGDLKYIPAHETLFYQALKECVVKEIANRRYFLEKSGMIRSGKNGLYKIPAEKVGKSKWEKDRRINLISMMERMCLVDENGNPRGNYKNRSKDHLYKDTKRQITGILAAMNEKGFIDGYYEYKTNKSGKKAVFAGWVVDPSIIYDNYYKKRKG